MRPKNCQITVEIDLQVRQRMRQSKAIAKSKRINSRQLTGANLTSILMNRLSLVSDTISSSRRSNNISTKKVCHSQSNKKIKLIIKVKEVLANFPNLLTKKLPFGDCTQNIVVSSLENRSFSKSLQLLDSQWSRFSSGSGTQILSLKSMQSKLLLIS